MALPLEEEIMREIGLGNHYYWYNGSGSCFGIRTEAVRLLGGVLRRRHAEGEEVAAPIRSLLVMLTKIAHNGDRSDYELTRTWGAAADVIRAHIEVQHNRKKKDTAAAKRIVGRTLECWSKYALPREGRVLGPDGLILDLRKARGQVGRFT